MMNAKVRDLLNQQINKEFYSAYPLNLLNSRTAFNGR